MVVAGCSNRNSSVVSADNIPISTARQARQVVETPAGSDQDGGMGSGKQSFVSWFASRWFGGARAPQRPARVRASRRTIFESLEPRYAPATLGLGIRVLDDNAGVPGAPRTTPLTVGEIFWVQVLAEDQRAANPQGIIALPLDLSWDAGNLHCLTRRRLSFRTRSLPLTW
jgi:hypothetical protein